MPHRNQLLALLARYKIMHPDENDVVVRYENFVRANADCFSRDNPHGHVTSSAFLVSPSGEVLLTHHKKLGEWLQLGGHADGDDDVVRVALKEAHEESGIESISLVMPTILDVDIHEIPEHKNVPEHFHYDVRFLLAAPSRDFVVSDESHNLAWINIDSIARGESSVVESESIKRMARKWCALQQQNL